MEWKNIYRGILMGVSNMIPGVSAGTIALILGIYDRLIGSISDFFSPDWRRTLRFLIPLGIGIVGAVFGLSRLIEWVMTHYFQPTQFFFLGLIVGVIPLLLREAKMKERFTWVHYLVLVIIAVSIGLIGTPEESTIVLELTFANGVLLFVAGWIASMSLLLPGISGALVLILFGVYYTAIDALNTFNVGVILVLLLGIIVGFVISSKFIKFLLNHYRYMTYAAIIGLLLGSLVIVYPGFIEGSQVIIPSVIMFIGGTSTAFFLGSRG